MPPPPGPGPLQGFYPITVGRGVSLAFHLFRFGWRTFVAINLVAFLPVALVSAAATYATYGQISDWQHGLVFNSIATNADASQALATFPWPAVAVTIAASFLVGPFSMFGQAALVDAVATALAGGRLSARRSLGAALARLPSIVGIYIVVALVGVALAVLSLGLPLLSVLPGLGITGGPIVFIGLVVFVAVFGAVVFVTIRFAFAVMTLIVERLPVRQALGRSWHLLGGSMLRLIGWGLVFGLILGLIGVIVGFIALLVSLIVSPVRLDSLATLPIGTVTVETVMTTLMEAVFAPLSTIGLTILYFEIRWRHGEAVPAPGQTAG